MRSFIVIGGKFRQNVIFNFSAVNRFFCCTLLRIELTKLDSLGSRCSFFVAVRASCDFFGKFWFVDICDGILVFFMRLRHTLFLLFERKKMMNFVTMACRLFLGMSVFAKNIM